MDILHRGVLLTGHSINLEVSLHMYYDVRRFRWMVGQVTWYLVLDWTGLRGNWWMRTKAHGKATNAQDFDVWSVLRECTVRSIIEHLASYAGHAYEGHTTSILSASNMLSYIGKALRAFHQMLVAWKILHQSAFVAFYLYRARDLRKRFMPGYRGSMTRLKQLRSNPCPDSGSLQNIKQMQSAI